MKVIIKESFVRDLGWLPKWVLIKTKFVIKKFSKNSF